MAIQSDPPINSINGIMLILVLVALAVVEAGKERAGPPRDWTWWWDVLAGPFVWVPLSTAGVVHLFYVLLGGKPSDVGTMLASPWAWVFRGATIASSLFPSVYTVCFWTRFPRLLALVIDGVRSQHGLSPWERRMLLRLMSVSASFVLVAVCICICVRFSPKHRRQWAKRFAGPAAATLALMGASGLAVPAAIHLLNPRLSLL